MDLNGFLTVMLGSLTACFVVVIFYTCRKPKYEVCDCSNCEFTRNGRFGHMPCMKNGVSNPKQPPKAL